MSSSAKHSPLLVALGWLAGGVIVALTVLWVPWHMDEFVMFHRLACMNPIQQLDPGPLGCDGFRSEVFGFEFHRAYSYIGAISSLIMWPFWLVWPSLMTTWLVGVLLLLGVAFGLNLSFRVPLRYGFFPMLFFPLAYNLIHDGGPVRLSLFVIAWSPWLLQRALRSPRLVGFLGWTALLVLGVMAALEDKPYFMYLLPGAIALSVAALPLWHIQMTWQTVRRASVAWGAALTGALVQLLVIRVDGTSYLAYLGSARPPLGARPVQALADLIRWSYDWPMWAHRAIEYPTAAIPAVGVVALVVVMPTVLLVIGWGAARWFWKRRETDWWTGASLLVSVFGFAAGAMWSGGWAGHHYVFVFVPVVVAVMLAWYHWGGRRRVLVAGGLAFASVLTLFVVRVSPLLNTSSSYISTIVNEAVRLSGPSDIINCASFGCGWQDVLLSQEDIPVFMGHWDEGVNEDALAAATARGGSILHVCLGCDQSAVEQQYPAALVEAEVESGGGWRVFRVTPGPVLK